MSWRERRGDERRGVLLVERFSPLDASSTDSSDCFGRRGAAASASSTGASTGAAGSGSGSKRGAGLRLRRFEGEAGWLPDGMMMMGLPFRSRSGGGCRWRAACRSRLRLCREPLGPSGRTQRRRASQRWCSAADQP